MPFLDPQNYPLWINLLLFAIAAGFIWRAGTRLVGYVDKIATQTGLGQAFAGMLLLGTITSLPEIANVGTASSTGSPALAVNNLLGSASINVLLLALVDAFVGRDALTSVVSRPVTLMQATLCMLVLTLVALAITVGDAGIFSIGLWSLAIPAASLTAFWVASRYQGSDAWRPIGGAEVSDPPAGSSDAETSAISPLVWKSAAAGAVIFIAGFTLSQTGDAIANQAGISEGLVGFVLLGLATSLPELSTITAALRMRRYEMAIGEVLGTNFVNMTLILLAEILFIPGLVINELGQFEIVSALLGVLLTGILLVGLLERRDRTIFRMGYDSFLIILTFAAGLIVLFFSQ